jgi:hypothetical protein
VKGHGGPLFRLLSFSGFNFTHIAAQEGRSPLHWASFHQQHKMVKMLLANGSDPFRVDNESRLCLHLCVGNTTTKTYQLLAKAMGARLDVNQRDKVCSENARARACVGCVLGVWVCCVCWVWVYMCVCWVFVCVCVCSPVSALSRSSGA